MKRPRRQRPQRLDPATASIAIIGSGLAGLSVAISLEQAGFTSDNIHMYERDESLQARKEGYGLTLTYNPAPAAILQALGVLEEVAAADCPSRCHYLFGANGEIQGYFGNAFSTGTDKTASAGGGGGGGGGGTGQRGNLRVPRQKIRSFLMERLKHTKIHWGYKLTGMEQNDDDDSEQVRLHFQVKESSSSASTSGAPTEATATSAEHKGEQEVVILADLVIAADGVRSSVVRTWLPAAPAPRSTGIRLIVGLTGNNFTHPLLHERGFYTLGDGIRLFVMPFRGNSLLFPDEPIQFMWQLSFQSACTTTTEKEQDEQAKLLWSCPEQLKKQALLICRDWHEPVQSMICATPIDTIWSTVLYDTDPTELSRQLSCHTVTQNNNTSDNSCSRQQRVILTGDALHAMTVFKGQGANQALQDGPVVAKWLVRASVGSAVAGCMREMVQRTAPVVKASRQAAMYWHSNSASAIATTSTASTTTTSPASTTASTTSSATDSTTTPATHTAVEHKFAGVPESLIPKLLQALRDANITAGTPHLDQCIQKVIDQLQEEFSGDNANVEAEADCGEMAAASKKNDIDVAVDEEQLLLFADAALQAAETGALGDLRELSWTTVQTTRSAGRGRQRLAMAQVRQAGTGRTLLHVAAAAGHAATVHWLVTEAACSLTAKDDEGQTSLYLAQDQGHAAVEDLLRRLLLARQQ
jgi:2-polyprenyl-6-methoxyphenol hydroxylase-like FAD-dependent oxidoreductase